MIASRFLIGLIYLAWGLVVIADSDDGGRRAWDDGDSTAAAILPPPSQQERQTDTRIHRLRGETLTTAQETGESKRARGAAGTPVEGAPELAAPREAAVARLEGVPVRGGGGDDGDDDARDRSPARESARNNSSSTSSTSGIIGGTFGGVLGRRSLQEVSISSGEQGGSRGGGRDGAAGWHGGRCWVDPAGDRTCQANVFLFGVSKCGTTSLAAWMTHHPALRWVSNLATIGIKGEEAHVLDEMGGEDFRAMLGRGPGGKYGQTAPVAEEEDKVIDYTPHCSIKAEVPYRILDIYGDAARNGSNTYLVQLRDPVARAISSWQRKFDLEALRDDFEEREAEGDTRSLAEAVRQGQDGVNALLECQEAERRTATTPWDAEQQKAMDLETCRLRDFLGETHGLYWAHVAKGMYAMQLERWFNLFGRENVKVTFLEETAADPVGALESVFDFIGLDLLDEKGKKGLPSRGHWERVVNTIHNETEEERKNKLGRQVTPSLVLSMRKFFAPHNARLEELLGRPLPENWSA